MNTEVRASKNALREDLRAFVAIGVSLLLIPYGQQALLAQDPQQPYPPQQQQYPQQPPPQGYPQQQQAPPPGNYAPLGADQLDQLVAPIALYPDALVAQVLTASTYPQQVMDANSWMQQYGGMPPEQRAAAANSMPWDPSIKSLTAFPDVLANLARNQNWTGALGNAYYNQPGDVMNAVQAMRFRAQQAGTLRSTPQNRVVYDGGLVIIEPVNPGLVYVPYYNPWGVYGVGLSPWGGYYYGGPPRGVVFAGGLGLGFAVGISVGLFAHYGWGYHAWAPNWHGGVVVYNHTTYISRSTTVINRGNFGGYNRGVFEHAGPGVPNNFRPAVTGQSAAFRSNPGAFRGSGYANQRPVGQTPQNAQGRQFGQPAPSRATGAPAQYGQSPRPAGQYAQPNRPAATAPRPEMTRPQVGATRPQMGAPQNNAPRSAPPSGGGAPRGESPRGAQSAPQQHAAPQAQHQGGGGGSHPAPKHEEKR
jgi:hypothetical protein